MSRPCGSSAESAVTELELSAWSTSTRATGCAGAGHRRGGHRHLRLGPATGRLTWDERLIRMFGYDAATFEEPIEAFNARLHPDDLTPGRPMPLQACIDTCGEYDAEYRVVPSGRRDPLGARARPGHPRRRTARRPAAGRGLRHHRCPGGRGLVTRVLEAMPAGFYSLDREWRFTHVNAEAERLLGRSREDLLGKVLWDDWSPRRSAASSRRTTAPPCGPACPSPSTPTTPRRWTAGTSCAPGPAPTACRSTSSRSPSAGRCSSRPSGPRERLALLARVSSELAGTLAVEAATARLPRHRRAGARRLLRPHRHRSDGRPAGRRHLARGPGQPPPAGAVRRGPAGRHAAHRAAWPAPCTPGRRPPSPAPRCSTCCPRARPGNCSRCWRRRPRWRCRCVPAGGPSACSRCSTRPATSPSRR